MTPETRAAFERALQRTPPPTATPVAALVGALSDDGQALVLQHSGRAWPVYVADPKTGKLRARWPGDGSRSDRSGRRAAPTFFARTHLVAFQELARSPGAPMLVVRDALLGTDELRVRFERGCTPATDADRLAWVGGDRVHVWDAKTRTEIDDFAVPEGPRSEGCLRLPSPSLVGVAWGGHDAPRTFLVRDPRLHKELARITGGAYGPVTATSLDGRFVAVGLSPDQRTDPPPRPGKTLLLDARTGATVAASDICPSPGSFAFDERSQLLAVGDLTDACVFALPSMKLARRTSALRPAFATGPWKVTQTISDLRFFGNGGLLARTQDGIYALFDASGAVAFKGERGGWSGVTGSAAAAVAHGFASSELGSASLLMDRHVRVTTTLRATEEVGAPADASKLVREAWAIATPAPLRAALERVAAESCLVYGELYPKEVCPARAP